MSDGQTSIPIGPQPKPAPVPVTPPPRRLSRYRPKAPALCHDCCEVLHDDPQGFLPRRARWQTVDELGIRHLYCDDHAETRRWYWAMGGRER